jgi:hypothetical protein
MAYTPYKLPNGKVVNVPMEEVNKSMRLLKLSKDEAIQMWLEDEGYMENEEQEALERKAKENRITATIHQARAEPKFTPKTQKERVHKDDPTKEGIIKAIAEMLPTLSATEVKIENVGKLITFKLGADTFKLDLIRQRPPKANK